MPALTTARLTLTPISAADAPFMLTLLNDPSWLRYIGDRGIRTVDQARAYIENGSIHSFAHHGFGSFVVRITATGAPIGVCGLYQRDYLPAPDVGFAFLPPFTGQGYASEATAATLAHGRTTLGMPRILAITTPANTASVKLLSKLGLRFEKMIAAPTGTEELRLFTTEPAPV
jgi:RimJ/RimL family protein N-acetyltransferase